MTGSTSCPTVPSTLIEPTAPDGTFADVGRDRRFVIRLAKRSRRSGRGGENAALGLDVLEGEPGALRDLFASTRERLVVAGLADGLPRSCMATASLESGNAKNSLDRLVARYLRTPPGPSEQGGRSAGLRVPGFGQVFRVVEDDLALWGGRRGDI